ncbi:MAG: hypothetical protein HC800_05210 [Phormidesmis sp. RL_2_1]|nr:hypothetical protein [Phormidesmis sp. RL_2_1]
MKRFLLASTTVLTALICLAGGKPAHADSLEAYCEYIPDDPAQEVIAMPCVFSQQQGVVGISWEDGVYNQFVPYGDGSGVYLDARGGLVYRQFGQGADLSFKMEAGSINVFWEGGC